MEHWLVKASKSDVYIGVICGLIGWMFFLMLLSFIKFIVYDKKQPDPEPNINEEPGCLDQFVESLFGRPQNAASSNQTTKMTEPHNMAIVSDSEANTKSHIQLSTEIPKDNMTTDENDKNEYDKDIDEANVTKKIWKVMKFIFFIALFVLDLFDDVSSLFAAKDFLYGVECTVGPSIDTSSVGLKMIPFIFMGMIIAVFDIYLVFEELCRNGSNMCCVHGGYDKKRKRNVNFMHILIEIVVTMFQDIAIMILLLIGAEQAGIVSDAWFISFALNAVTVIVYSIKGIYDVMQLSGKNKSDTLHSRSMIRWCSCCSFIVIIVVSILMLGYGIFTAKMDTEQVSINGVTLPDSAEFGDNELYGSSDTDYLIVDYEVDGYTFDIITCDAIHGVSLSCTFDSFCHVSTSINNCASGVCGISLDLCYAICQLE